MMVMRRPRCCFGGHQFHDGFTHDECSCGARVGTADRKYAWILNISGGNWTFYARNEEEKAGWIVVLQKVVKVDAASYVDVHARRTVKTTARQKSLSRAAAAVGALPDAPTDLQSPTAQNTTLTLLRRRLDQERYILQELERHLEEVAIDAPPTLVQDVREQRKRVSEVERELRQFLKQRPEADNHAPSGARGSSGGAAAVAGVPHDAATTNGSVTAMAGSEAPTMGAAGSALPSDGVRPLTQAARAEHDARSAVTDLDKTLADMLVVHNFPTTAQPDEEYDTRASVCPLPEPRRSEADAMEALAALFEEQRTTCTACGQPIADDERTLLALGKVWHKDHFCCCHCHKPLESLMYYRHMDQAYCEEDYVRLFNRCAQCNNPIEDSEYVNLATDADDSGARWHKEHFICAECKCNLMDQKVYDRSSVLYCEADYLRLFGAGCAQCGELISAGNYIDALGKQWHEACFYCHYDGCRAVFPDGKYSFIEDWPYCDEHFHQLRGTLCVQCRKPIDGRFVDAGGHRLHPDCFACHKCAKLIPLGARFGVLDSSEKPQFLCDACLVKPSA